MKKPVPRRGVLSGIAEEFLEIVRSPYTYVTLGVLAFVAVIQSVMVLSGKSALSSKPIECVGVGNLVILACIFMGILFALMSVAGIGEVVKAIDLHARGIKSKQAIKHRNGAFKYFGFSALCGIVIAFVMNGWC